MVKKTVKLPILAAGGIASGAAMLAVMNLGADGVQIGSRFAASVESSAHQNFKEAILHATEGDTMLSIKKVVPVRLLKNKLIKMVSLITPNIPEAEILTNTKIKSKEDMIYAASKLLNLGAKNVFIKGGHLNSKIVQDIFVNKKEIMIFKNNRITTNNTHGTGCTLSSAITSFFGCGKTLKKSCELATKYVNNSINSKINFGKGHGPINHLSSITIEKEFR